jgi:hypothetical protein
MRKRPRMGLSAIIPPTGAESPFRWQSTL